MDWIKCELETPVGEQTVHVKNGNIEGKGIYRNGEWFTTIEAQPTHWATLEVIY